MQATLRVFILTILCKFTSQVTKLKFNDFKMLIYASTNTAYKLLSCYGLIRRRRLSVFGHIARLTQGTQHNALHCQVSLASGRSLGGDWRRRPGRPCARWTDQLRNDTGSVPANLWRQAGHSTGPL